MDTDMQVFRFLLSKSRQNPQQYHHVEEIVQAINKKYKKCTNAHEVEIALNTTRYIMPKNLSTLVPGHDSPYEIVHYEDGIVSARISFFAALYPRDYGWPE